MRPPNLALLAEPSLSTAGTVNLAKHCFLQVFLIDSGGGVSLRQQVPRAAVAYGRGRDRDGPLPRKNSNRGNVLRSGVFAEEDVCFAYRGANKACTIQRATDFDRIE